jgi:tetratricopeptide (TPR) repeat protein
MARQATLQTDPSFVPSGVGQRIRHARQERSLSLAQLGGTELTRGFISAVETGRSSISLKALSYIADRLDLPMTYFLDGQEDSRTLLPELQLDDAEERLRTQRPAEALEILLAVTAPDTLRSRQLWLHGWALHDLGRAREAIPRLQEALARAESEGDRRHTILVQYMLATAFFAATNYEEALEHLRRAHSRTVDLGDDALLGKLTVALGHIYLAQGQTDVALAQYARARQLFNAVDDLNNLAAVYSGLSRLHRQKGDLRAAIRYGRLGLGIWEAKQNQREAAHELANIAARYEEIGETDLALTTALEAVTRAQQSKAPDIEGLARSSLAAVYLRLGRTDDAREQAAMVQQLGLHPHDLGFIDTVIVLAKLAEQAGNDSESDALYGQALAALEQNGLHGRYADVALAYSEALSERGDLVRAFEFAKRAAKTLTARPA